MCKHNLDHDDDGINGLDLEFLETAQENNTNIEWFIDLLQLSFTDVRPCQA